MASFGRTSGGSCAKRSMPGTMPEVETVMRCGLRPTSSHQQPHRGHEVVVVQKRLAHAHEDQVHAVAANLDAVPVEHGHHLPGNLARGEVALQAEFRGEAELAIDRAAHLA